GIKSGGSGFVHQDLKLDLVLEGNVILFPDGPDAGDNSEATLKSSIRLRFSSPAFGQLAIINASCGVRSFNCCQISSEMKGTKGCSSTRLSSRIDTASL